MRFKRSWDTGPTCLLSENKLSDLSDMYTYTGFLPCPLIPKLASNTAFTLRNNKVEKSLGVGQIWVWIRTQPLLSRHVILDKLVSEL